MWVESLSECRFFTAGGRFMLDFDWVKIQMRWVKLSLYSRICFIEDQG